MTDRLDPSFAALPLSVLADAALSRAQQLGCSHADFRVGRKRSGYRMLRDAAVESVRDSDTIGLSVRVIHEGSWGFASGAALSVAQAAALADQAVALAKIAKPLQLQPVELAPEPVYTGQVWVSDYEINPFDVEEAERISWFADRSAQLLSATGVDHVRAGIGYTQENKFYADLAGTSTTQQFVRLSPSFSVTNVGDGAFHGLRTVAPAVGRGWEYLSDGSWDFEAELAQLPEQLLEKVKAPTLEPGRYDLVIDPSNLWLTLHESVAHGTELDRALGYEAAYAGSSFATFDQLGSLQYGSEKMHVTGDRVTPHGLASCGFDDEGVAAQSFDLVKDGVLVGFQLNRQMAQEKGLGRSNGCAYADQAGHIPLQRMPNVSLQPDPHGPDVAGLIADVEDGIYVVGDNSWSIDMQRYNFQFTAQRFVRIKNGQLAGQVKDIAYQATTTDFWGSMDGVGNPSTYVLEGCFNCGKGQPGQEAPVSHGAPTARFRKVNVISTVEG